MARPRNEMGGIDLSDEHMGAVFKAALGICGLSNEAAAEFIGVSVDTVKKWCSGKRNVPPFAWQPIAKLYTQIVEVSEAALEALDADEINDASLALLAEDVGGERLPNEGATRAAMAMFVLSRIDE